MSENFVSLSVRIRDGNKTIGSGLLYVSKLWQYACVFTDAHVLENANYPVTIQCYPDSKQTNHEKFWFRVEKQDVVIHDQYTKALDQKTQTEYDVALARLPWKEWMENRPEISWGKAKRNMQLRGYGYAANSTEDNIQLDYFEFTPEKSSVTNEANNMNRAYALLGGKFHINQANRAQEYSGLSGSALAEAKRKNIVIVAFANNIQAVNGLGDKVALTGVRPAEELIEQEKNRERVKLARGRKFIRYYLKKWRKWLRALAMVLILLIWGANECLTLRQEQGKVQEFILEEMPRELQTYEVTINGDKINLPTTFAHLERLGWVFTNEEEMRNKRISSNSGDIASLTDGNGSFTVYYQNPGENKVGVDDCVIYQLVLDDYLLNSTIVEGPLGLTLGKSVWPDVKWPDGYKLSEKELRNPGVYFDYHVEKEGGDEQHYTFRFTRESGVLDHIMISNQDKHTAFELARSIERPNFETADLAQWMGVEIEIQRGTYCFPVGKLLSEYESLGYAFECSMIGYYQDDLCFGSGGWGYVYLNKEDLDVRSQLYNPFSFEKLDKYCFIGRITSCDVFLPFTAEYDATASESGTEPIPYRPFSVHFILDDCEYLIPEGMSRTDLETMLEENDVSYAYENNGDILIFPNRENEGIKIRCVFNGNFDAIKDIQVDICDALQAYFADETDAGPN